MPTPNSPSAQQTVDIHADPDFRSQFGTNVGEKILETADVGALVGAPTEPESPTMQEDWNEAPGGLTCNVGRTEQQIRLVAGTALLATAAFAPVNRWWRIGMAVFGAGQIVTGVTQHCPVWRALGVNTCRDGER